MFGSVTDMVEYVKSSIFNTNLFGMTSVEVPSKINDIMTVYGKTMENLEIARLKRELEKLEAEKLETENSLLKARDTCRVLNRRSQKYEKEINRLKKSANTYSRIKKDLYKKLEAKDKRLHIFLNSMREYNIEKTKTSEALSNWKNLAKKFYHDGGRLHGIVVTYQKENDFATSTMKVGNGYVASKIKANTRVKCIAQTNNAKHTLVTFIDGLGRKQLAWLPSNNIQLYPKPQEKKVEVIEGSSVKKN